MSVKVFQQIPRPNNIKLFLLGLIFILMAWIFQSFDWLNLSFTHSVFYYYDSSYSPITFILNKFIRFLFTNIGAIICIKSYFKEKKIIQTALVISLFHLIFLFPFYIWISLSGSLNAYFYQKLQHILLQPLILFLYGLIVRYSKKTSN